MAMSASASHANAATTELLGLSAQQRIRAIRSERWVSYPRRCRKRSKILEQILDHPRTDAYALDRDLRRLWGWARPC